MIATHDRLKAIREKIVQLRETWPTSSLVWVADVGHWSTPLGVSEEPRYQELVRLGLIAGSLGDLRHPPHPALNLDGDTFGHVSFDPGDEELKTLTNGTYENVSLRHPSRQIITQKLQRAEEGWEAVRSCATTLGTIVERLMPDCCEVALTPLIRNSYPRVEPRDWTFAWIFRSSFTTASKRPDRGVIVPDVFGCLTDCVDELLEQLGHETAASQLGDADWIHSFGTQPPAEFFSDKWLTGTQEELGFALRHKKHKEVGERQHRNNIKRMALVKRPKIWCRATVTGHIDVFLRHHEPFNPNAVLKELHEAEEKLTERRRAKVCQPEVGGSPRKPPSRKRT